MSANGGFQAVYERSYLQNDEEYWDSIFAEPVSLRAASLRSILTLKNDHLYGGLKNVEDEKQKILHSD